MGCIEKVNAGLDKLLSGDFDTGLYADDFEDAQKPLCEKINVLSNRLNELNQFASALSRGDLDITPPPRENYLASSLKGLYSNLKHLTWQTKQIANGDYGQRVDFMGDFSEAFNSMTQMLDERETQLKKEISERIKAQNQLEFFAYSDPLTGLSNRRTGLIVLKKAIDAGLMHNKALSVCFIDVDGLKMVNDTYGHDDGDFLITTISDILKSSVRSSDSFQKLIDNYDKHPSEWLSTVSRLGGDEFLLVLPDCDFDTANMIMKRILKMIEEKNKDFNKPYKLSISFGITSTDQIGDASVDELINSADAKMYEQKVAKKMART